MLVVCRNIVLFLLLTLADGYAACSDYTNFFSCWFDNDCTWENGNCVDKTPLSDECNPSDFSTTLNSSNPSYVKNDYVQGSNSDTFYVDVTEPGEVTITVTGNRMVFTYDESGCPPFRSGTQMSSHTVSFASAADFNLHVFRSNGNNTQSYTLEILFTPLNQAPLINDATSALDENAINGTVVYDVNDANSGNDTDQDGDNITYSISSGNSDNIFAINASTGVISVNDNTNLDYETTQQYTLLITASDGSLSDTATITININDIYEPPNIFAEYHMDECIWDGTANEVEDSSANANHATAQNGVTTTDDTYQIQRAAYFDGVDDYIVQNNLYETLKATASLSFWIKTTQTGNDTVWQAPGILGVEQSGGADDIFWGWLDASGHIGITAKGDSTTVKSINSVNNNVWHHIVLTRNHNSGEVKLYVDGVFEDSDTLPSGIIDNSFNRIGSIQDTGGTPTYFEGYLDEVNIYSNILNDSQISTIYNNERTGKNYDGSTRVPVSCGGCGSYSGELAQIQLVGDQLVMLNTYSNPSMTSVTYKDNYIFSENPVIFVLPDTSGGNPANMRVKNVNSRGFQIATVEPQGEDGAHISMKVDYFAINVGSLSGTSASQVYQLGNQFVEVGFIKTTKVQKGYDTATNSWEVISPKGNFCNPVVVAQIQGMANEPSYNPAAPSSPFLTTAVEIDGSNIKLALERSETNTGTLTEPEVIAYMISDANVQDSFIDDEGRTIKFETIQTAKKFMGWDDSAVSQNFVNTYAGVPLVAASLNSRDSLDGGWFRKKSHTKTNIALQIDEDRKTNSSGSGNVQDTERSKTKNSANGNPTTPESAGIFVFDGIFSKTGHIKLGSINAVNVAEKEIFDGNISTQIAGTVLELALVAREDDNITLRDANISKVEIVNCADDLCLDCLITDDALTIFENNVSTIEIPKATGYKLLTDTLSYTLTRANKRQKIRLTEFGKPPSCSFDTFAVRPKNFNIAAADPVYAGENFSLIFKALNAAASPTLDYNETDIIANPSFIVDYNETKAGCNSGEVLSHGDILFTHGTTPLVDANYTALAQFLNINISESNGSEYAKIDNDDTPESIRFITPGSVNITVLPYELNVTLSEINASTLTNWVYMADVNDMNITLHVNVQANNKQHEVLKDFNTSCYAQDINIRYGVTTDGDADLDMNYTAVTGTFSDGSTVKDEPLKDINQTMTIPSGNFTLGEGNATMALNVHRKHYESVTPFKIIGLAATITTAGVAKELNHDNSLNDGAISLYYGRLKTTDIKTSQASANSLIEIEVYDNENGSAYTNGFKQNSLHWWRHENHTSDTFGDAIDINATTTTTYTRPLAFSIPAANIGNPNNGTIALSVPQNQGRYILHVKTQPWLWYIPKAFGSSYNDAINSKCSEHPCLIYTFEDDSTTNNISTGTYKGGESKVYDRGESTKKGVKVFR